MKNPFFTVLLNELLAYNSTTFRQSQYSFLFFRKNIHLCLVKLNATPEKIFIAFNLRVIASSDELEDPFPQVCALCITLRFRHTQFYRKFVTLPSASRDILQITGIIDLTFKLLNVIFVLHKKGVSDGFSQIFMARYQSVSDYRCVFDLHDCCRFHLAIAAPFNVAAAAIFRKTLSLCRNDQGLVRNSLPS